MWLMIPSRLTNVGCSRSFAWWRGYDGTNRRLEGKRHLPIAPIMRPVDHHGGCLPDESLQRPGEVGLVRVAERQLWRPTGDQPRPSASTACSARSIWRIRRPRVMPRRPSHRRWRVRSGDPVDVGLQRLGEPQGRDEQAVDDIEHVGVRGSRDLPAGSVARPTRGVAAGSTWSISTRAGRRPRTCRG